MRNHYKVKKAVGWPNHFDVAVELWRAANLKVGEGWFNSIFIDTVFCHKFVHSFYIYEYNFFTRVIFF